MVELELVPGCEVGLVSLEEIELTGSGVGVLLDLESFLSLSCLSCLCILLLGGMVNSTIYRMKFSKE